MDDAAKWLREQPKAIEAELASLVGINSFTENKDGGLAVGRALEELFELPGLTCTRTASSSGKFADHLTFSNGGENPIALVGHLDTVFPPGTFEGFKRDGDLGRGPGVLDMKGGLCVVAWALKALVQSGELPPLRLVIVADEEVGSPEGQAIIRGATAGSKGALVFEAGRKNDLIITRRKGTGSVVVTAHGKAAHAGANHKDGVNALWALAKLVDRLQNLTDYDRGITVNVGKFTSGTSKNTVPDEATALVDFRFETRADGEEIVAKLKVAAEECAAAVPGSTIEVKGGIARLPLERTDASAALMAAYGEAAKAVGLGAGEANLIGGGSDASTTSAIGIASIDGLGPRGIGFHTHDEQIEISTLIQKAEALARFLARFRSAHAAR